MPYYIRKRQESRTVKSSDSFFLKILFIDFREGGRKGRKYRCEKHWSDASCMCSVRTEPTTQACALTRNGTGSLPLCRTMPDQLSHTGQGGALILKTHAPGCCPSSLPIDHMILLRLTIFSISLIIYKRNILISLTLYCHHEREKI